MKFSKIIELINIKNDMSSNIDMKQTREVSWELACIWFRISSYGIIIYSLGCLTVEEKENVILTAMQSDRHHFHLCVVDKENHKAIVDLIRKKHF